MKTTPLSHPGLRSGHYPRSCVPSAATADQKTRPRETRIGLGKSPSGDAISILNEKEPPASPV